MRHPVAFLVPLQALHKEGTQTLFHGVWTYDVKVIDFQSFYEIKNWIKLSFILEKS